MSKKIGITDTTLRDAHQSLLATRMKTEDMLPILEKMDQVGYHSMEVWGGATFDTCMRFLNEDPWKRLDQIKSRLKKTPTQMLLRGQNLVGYRHYTDDVVEAFVNKAVDHGMDIFRIFDALNDPKNLAKPIEAVKKAGGQVQGTISYTTSPVHNTAYFAKFCKTLADMGADSICIKDMAGLCRPYAGAELVSAIQAEVNLPIQLHTHYTTGLGAMMYLKGVEAGAAVIDTCSSAMALSTSQPSTEAMVAAFMDTPYDTGLDINLLAEINDYFREVRKTYAAFDITPPQVDTQILKYQIPGGMLSNFIGQLQETNALDRLSEVLEEVVVVRKDLGYPPLVTPTSQIVGQQALVNVLYGRYNRLSNEVRNYLKGMYGTTPAPVDKELQDQVLKGAAPITGRSVDGLEPMLPGLKAEAGDLIKSEEDLLLYAMFPAVAKEFLEKRDA
jgi:oxaloacetate decarboxylase alpha subunit